MALGSHVPFEIRDEVEKNIRSWYQGEPKIASIRVDFSTDFFPHKGMASIWFGTTPTSFECNFEYKYGATGEKDFVITRDWRD